ncbi:MAG: hypothetical protein IJ193_06650, partial [Bacilli bacterium]|nr:hypothetical protein [Bacilli bacterium]
MNNGTNNEPQRETIEAAKVYRLSPEQKQEEKKEEVTTAAIENKVEEPVVQKPVKKKNIIARLFFLIILGMGGYIAFQTYQYNLYRTYMV